ncbi:uncharacterized protein LOC143850209 [Tasmannia lanceolata]|uniref:uncharacterized protein LOC143850209 n=1 Tax=Tasmannia lanceolata TaxID=3420 RepID=UPI004063F12E
MAVTHADLSPGHQKTDFASQLGVFLMISSILCGLACFILCLIAEAMRSELTWLLMTSESEGGKYECVYSGSGRTALLCAVGAFVALAMAMVMKHGYILVALANPNPSLIAWTPNSISSKALTWQACFFFLTTWVSFAISEVLLTIGIIVESGHLRSRPSCLIIQPGLFVAAGVFGLATVFLAAGLYLTILRAQRLCQDEGPHLRQEIEGGPTSN